MADERASHRLWRELATISASDRWRLVEMPMLTQLYVLDKDAQFEHEDAFAATCVLEYLHTEEVYVRGLLGHFDREIYARLERHLKEHGIEAVRFRHKRRNKTILL